MSPKTTAPARSYLGHSHEVNSILHLQRTIGNQAVQRLLQSNAEERNTILNGTTSPHFGHDFSRIPIHPPVAGAIQTKLAINTPGDEYEQEADRVADEVMRMPEPLIQMQRTRAACYEYDATQSKPFCVPFQMNIQRQAEFKEEEGEPIQAKPIAEQIMPLVQRQSEIEEEEEVQTKLIQGAHVGRQENPEKEDEEKPLQTKHSGGWSPETGVDLSNQIHLLRGGGQPLPKSTRNFFEPRFGCDFSQVRVHTEGKAADTARRVQSRAFTVGHDVFFSPGEFLPETNEGKKLIAHELVHTVQQRPARHANYSAMPASQIAGFGTTTIQRAIPMPRAPDDETARNASRQIEAARRRLSNIGPDERQELEAEIAQAEAALQRYRASHPRGGTSPMVATTTTGNPAGIIFALFALAASLIVAQSASQSAAQRQAADALGRQLNALASALETAVLMTAAGNVIHGHIVDEARQLAITLGLAASATAVTREMLCEMLRRMATQNRRTDTEKWKKIISTMKGLNCRRSRAGR